MTVPVLLGLQVLVLLPEMQVRGRTVRRVVEDYRRAFEAGAVFPPVVVARVEGALVLVDGFHRVAALKALHRGAVEAEVSDAGSMEEALWRAAAANLRHGLPLNGVGRRNAFRAYVRAGQHRLDGRRRGRLKSYREMAADLPGVHYTTLRKWMKADFPATYQALAASGGRSGAPGGLAPGAALEASLERTIVEALESAGAAVAGISDPMVRGRVLKQVEALRATLVAEGVEATPF